jgi:hypothetical protein
VPEPPRKDIPGKITKKIGIWMNIVYGFCCFKCKIFFFCLVIVV